MRFRVVHTTHYRYSTPVILCHNEAHLRPITGARQRCEESAVTVSPTPALHHRRQDYFGNAVDYFRIQEMHDVLTVRAASIVDVSTGLPAPLLAASMAWETAALWLRRDPSEGTCAVREFVLDSPLIPTDAALAAFALPSFPAGRPLLEAVHDLSRRIHEALTYDRTSTTVATPLHEVLASRRGVCQDFAHFAIGCLRSIGVPARYVSGYVESISPADRPQVRGADASHAWFAVFERDAGWVDFDPTNDQVVGAQHITTAWGRDYSDVSPLKGVIFGGGNHVLEVAVDVARMSDAPSEQ